jgi:cation transport ATPase
MSRPAQSATNRIAGLAMALSSVSVVGNAPRLRRFEPGGRA